jgi:hypothetical protein
MVERQLDLLKGPRQRGVRPTGATEFEMHCVIADYLRVGKAPGWLWFHPPNGGERSAIWKENKDGTITRRSIEGGRLKRMGARAGVSDFILIQPGGARVHVLELKRRGEKPTESQLLFMDEVEQAGGKVAWVDTVDDALAVLEGWGAIRRQVRVSV